MQERSDIDFARLARIDERTMNTQKLLHQHVEDDNKRFERTFNYIKDQFEKLDKNFEKLGGKIDTLWDEKNERKGAFGASKLIGGAVWIVITVAASAALTWFMRRNG